MVEVAHREPVAELQRVFAEPFVEAFDVCAGALHHRGVVDEQALAHRGAERIEHVDFARGVLLPELVARDAGALQRA